MDASEYRRITRRKGACVNCRQRKVRCDGAPTCSQCLKLKLECAYRNLGVSNRNQKRRIDSLEVDADTYPGSDGSERGKEYDRDSSGFQYGVLEATFGSDFTPFFVDPAAIDFTFGSQSIDVTTEVASTPELGDKVFPWRSDRTFDEKDHPLDHIIGFVDSHQQGTVWPKVLYQDFSTFSPVRSLGQSMDEMIAKNKEEDLRRRIWQKVQSSARMDDSRLQASVYNALPYYALPESLEFIDLFFQDQYSYPAFVSKEVVLRSFEAAMRSSSRMDQSAFVLLNSVLAIGCQNASGKHRGGMDKRLPTPNTRPLQYLQWALDARYVLNGGQPSMLKLQALVTMIILVQRYDAALTRALLSQAIAMVADLSQTISLSGPVSDAPNADELEHIFWLLYSIEKPHALRFGSHSIVDDDLLIYHAPSKRRSNSLTQDPAEYSGWEIVNYRYARLCSVIVKTLYSHVSMRMTGQEVTAAINRLSDMLEAWRMSIPVPYRPYREPDSPVCHEHVEDVKVRASIALRYSEATLAIHRWIFATHNCSPKTTLVYASSRAQCIMVAKRVLTDAHACRADSGIEWPVVMLPALSAILLYMLMQKAEAGKDCLPYLGIAAGFFGELHVKADFEPDLFAEMSELFSKARPESALQSVGQTSSRVDGGSTEDESASNRTERELGHFGFPLNSSDSIFDTPS